MKKELFIDDQAIQTPSGKAANSKLRHHLIGDYRRTDLPVEPCFLARWSPRAFDKTVVPEEDLMTMLEAARWAPSAYNVQPWRFLYALREDEYWLRYLSLLDAFNAGWAKNAGALVFLLSDSLVPESNPPRVSASHSFDTGAAWAHIALQAQMLGYQAHAMGGIYHTKIKELLKIPKRFKVEIGIAIGVVGDPAVLPDELRQREKPSVRKPLETLNHAGYFCESMSGGKRS